MNDNNKHDNDSIELQMISINNKHNLKQKTNNQSQNLTLEDYWKWENLIRQKNNPKESVTQFISQNSKIKQEQNVSIQNYDSGEWIDYNIYPRPKQTKSFIKASQTLQTLLQRRKQAHQPSKKQICYQYFLYSNLHSDVKLKMKGYWKSGGAILKQQYIMFQQQHKKISKITKLKILSQTINGTDYALLKFIYGKQIVFFAASIHQMHLNLYPKHFAWFVGILMRKLETMEIQQQQQEKFALSQTVIFDNSNCRFSGFLWKRSQFLGQWARRWVIIRENGIYSYNTAIDRQHETFFIASNSIRYIWTRFEIYNNCLIFKIKHNLRKTQFAVPLDQLFNNNFTCLYQIYKLMIYNSN